MPSYPCKHPTCSAYVARRGEACPVHGGEVRQQQADRQQRYDQTNRDPRAKSFYNSAAWKAARKLKLATDPVCERCGATWARHVHHEKPLRSNWDLRLDPNNLRSLCPECHNAVRDTEAE